MFERSLQNGVLDLKIIPIVFYGVKDTDCANAKHIIFQEPLTADSSKLVSLEHNIYYKSAGSDNPLNMVEHDNVTKAILCALKDDSGERPPAPSPILQQSPVNKDPKSVRQTPVRHEIPAEVPIHLTKQVSISSKTPDSEFNKQPSLPSRQAKKILAFDDRHDEPMELSEVKYLEQYKNSCKVEFYHSFNCSSFINISEILRLFIKNVSLCVFVTDLSQELNHREVSMLEQFQSFSSKGLIIGACTSDLKVSPKIEDANNVLLHQYSKYLIHQPHNYVHHLNCQEPQKSDTDVGLKIIDHAASFTRSKPFPFSWYLFGFKLRHFMLSSGINIARVSIECMEIADTCSMNRPTIEAALQHLAEHNIILYFGDILNDIVFADANLFAEMFSSLPQTSIVQQSDLVRTFQPFESDQVHCDDFMKLFIKLMIMVPYNESSYLFPCFLRTLNESERNKAFLSNCNLDLQPLCFKCPSKGHEFISFLIAFLLTLPNKQWNILKNSEEQPVCLYKNCVTVVSDDGVKYTITFFSCYVAISLNSPVKTKMNNIADMILRGFEEIKLLLNKHKSFDFKISFECTCKQYNNFHTMEYDKELNVLICEKSGSEIVVSPDHHFMKWIEGNIDYSMNTGHLTVNNVLKTLAPVVDQWIKVAGALDVPQTIVDSVLVSRLSDKDCLRQVVEWWFKNTANPEWATIESTLKETGFVKYSDPYQDPLAVTEINTLQCHGPHSSNRFPSESYGKWMFFRNFEDLNETWCVIREEVISGRLGATGALCNTLRYDPISAGAGPSTTGRISVFTNKDTIMEVGFKLISLQTIQHDIKYKTQEDTWAGKFSHIYPGQQITKFTLYWNNGHPSTKLIGRKCPPKCRDDRRHYDPSSDRWKINIVNGISSYSVEPIYGKWIIKSSYDRNSEVNISKLWHTLKSKIEEDKIPAIRMECPASKQQDDSPEIHVFTSKNNKVAVGKVIIAIVKKDVTYVAKEGNFKDDFETLYWNKGEPSNIPGDNRSRRYPDPDQNPLEVTDQDVVRCPAPSYTVTDFETKSHGKWIFFRNFEDINDTWYSIREAIKSNYLGATGAMCNTLWYNPLNSGAGPSTTGRIMVFTLEDNMMDVGMKLIKLPVIQHDIKYKTQEDTKARKLSFMESKERVTVLTLFWNDGFPSTSIIGHKKPPKTRNDKYNYDPSIDRWKINIVQGASQYTSEQIYGKWILQSNYDAQSEINITKLWHSLKPRVESGEIPAIRMECPPSKQKGDKPEIFVFTSKRHMTAVGMKLILLLRTDIRYVVGGGTFRGDLKRLYWNRGEPSYDQGSQKSWREGKRW